MSLREAWSRLINILMKTKAERLAQAKTPQQKNRSSDFEFTAPPPATLDKPKRIYELHLLALELGASVSLRLTPTGPEVKFLNERTRHLNTTLTYASEAWEVELVAEVLADIQLIREREQQELRELALKTAADLSPEQRAALKSHPDLL